MAGKVLDLENLLSMDNLAVNIAKKWHEWNLLRNSKFEDLKEVRKYVYQTDTTQTSNVKLPWKNKTTVPKLCQIRDNLHANYMQSMFPKRRWVKWEGADEESSTAKKKEAIETYARWMIDRPEFRNEISKLAYDFIDAGNAFVMPEWVDNRNETDRRDQLGYIGPSPLRLSPDDIVFNPIAASFYQTPKIIRQVVSLGEVKKYIEQISVDENTEAYQELFNYLREVRRNISSYSPDLKDEYFRMDGFTSFRSYLESDYAELLIFKGNLYDIDKDEYLQNYEIIVVDRHKVLKKEPSESYLGIPAIFHTGWRPRQDNLWAMGPLDNLVGMQYRIDHLENLKSDLYDLTAFPPLKIKGYVEDFDWGPFEKIHTDSDGDVEIMSPDVNALNANLEISVLEQKMEEMAGSPKEAMGFRTPGEKTAFEVQRLENAASRIFQSKIVQFEEQIVEPLLNAMLEMGRRNMDSTQVRIFDDEFGLEIFKTLTPEDIAGNGRIRPVAARHFAETAERIQNLTNFANSPLYADPTVNVHWSGLETSKMIEELLDIEQFNIVQPFIRISEQAEGQKMLNTQEEDVINQASTPSGLTPEDSDEDFL